MAPEELHGIVDIEKIEPKSVNINENWEEAAAGRRVGPSKTYTITYSLPIKVSKTWQYMFQRPDTMSGVVHQVNFEFSEDGGEISTTLENEPAPELLLVLKKYAERANKRWEQHMDAMIVNRSDEEKILKRLRDSM